MMRAVLVLVVAFLASANAFLAPVPGYSPARTARASSAVRMVTSPSVSTPSVATSTGNMGSSESVYTEALKKMEVECLTDLEKAFEETAKTAKAESEKIWAELNAEFDEEDNAETSP